MQLTKERIIAIERKFEDLFIELAQSTDSHDRVLWTGTDSASTALTAISSYMQELEAMYEYSSKAKP